MALVVKDRVKETTTTTGTGTMTLAGAATGFQSFAEIGNSNTTYYAIKSGNNWEVGLGTYTSSGTTLSRDAVLESSNSGSAITLAGTSDVFCTYPAEKAVLSDSTNTLTNKSIAATQLTGTVPTARLGSGTASSSTYLKGDNSWGAISASSETLEKSFTLTSGKTVTAGIMVSVDSSGEVGTLPAVNTLGTYRATSNTHQYGGANTTENGDGGISYDGSRGLSFSGTASYNDLLRGYSGSQASRVVTVTGHAFATNATTVDGTTTVTVPIPNTAGPASLDACASAHPYDGAWQVHCYPVSNTSFMVITQSGSGNAATPLSNQTSWTWDYTATIITVDASGDLTKGTTATSSHTSTTEPPAWVALAGTLQSRLSENTFIAGFNYNESHFLTIEPTYNLKRVFKWDGSTGVTIYKSNFAAKFGQVKPTMATMQGCVRTSGNKIVWGDYANIYMLPITDADGGLGLDAAITTTALSALTVSGDGVAIVGDQWSMTKPAIQGETKLMLSGYNYGGNGYRANTTLSVSSAGVVTVDTGTYETGSSTVDVHQPRYETTSGYALKAAGFRTLTGVTYVNTYSVNSAGLMTGSNLGVPVTGGLSDLRSTVRFNGTDYIIFTRESNSLSANQVTVNLVVGASATDPINFVGFPSATDSTSPATIIVNGVAGGFSSLTPGLIYYENVLHNGTVTTDPDTGVKVGKAVSATEILIDRTV